MPEVVTTAHCRNTHRESPFENFSTFAEYNYSDYGQAALKEPDNENRFDSEDIKNHAIKLGIRYNF